MIDVVQCHREKCCACVLLCVNGCIPVPKKPPQKVRERKGQHGLFSGCSINCSSNLQIIILLYTCINRCLVSAGENVPLSTTKERIFIWLVRQIKRVAFITCFYVRQYIILFADVFVYLKVNILIMCKKKRKKLFKIKWMIYYKERRKMHNHQWQQYRSSL